MHRFVVLLALVGLMLLGGVSQAAPPIYRVAFSPDGKWLALASGSTRSGGGPVEIWDVATWQRRYRHAEEKGAADVAFSPDSKQYAYGTWDSDAKVANVADGKVVSVLKHPLAVAGVAFSSDGRRLLTGCYDRKIRIWDLATRKTVRELDGHSEKINSLCVSPDGALLISTSHDRTARLWDLASGEVKYTSPQAGSIMRRCAFSADGRFFLTTDWGGRTFVRETATGQARIALRSGGTDCAMLSSDNRLLAVAGQGRDVKVFHVDLAPPTAEREIEIRELIHQFENDDFQVREAASKRLIEIGLPAVRFLDAAKASSDAEVRVRSRLARKAIRSLAPDIQLGGHEGDTEVVAFSPDGKLIVTGSRGGSVKIWSAKDFRELRALVVSSAD